jgi:hypothetical protein
LDFRTLVSKKLNDLEKVTPINVRFSKHVTPLK